MVALAANKQVAKLKFGKSMREIYKITSLQNFQKTFTGKTKNFDWTTYSYNTDNADFLKFMTQKHWFLSFYSSLTEYNF